MMMSSDLTPNAKNENTNDVENGAYQPSSTDGELLDVVDFDDRKIGTASRGEIHAKGLIHRAIHVILCNPQGQFLQQKRSQKKDRFPGWWDISVGGHVNSGELYQEAAHRECREEMGLEALELERVAIMTPTAMNGFEHIHVFLGRLPDEPAIKFNTDEITAVRWITLADYQAKAHPASEDAEWRVTPCSYDTLKEWMRIGAPGTKPVA